MQLIPQAELMERYPRMVELSKIFGHEVIEDDEGIWRWKSNRLMCHFVNGAEFHVPPRWDGKNAILLGGLDMNGLMSALHQECFSIEELMKFYMQIGYSLCGFIDVFSGLIDQTIEEHSGERLCL